MRNWAYLYDWEDNDEQESFPAFYLHWRLKVHKDWQEPSIRVDLLRPKGLGEGLEEKDKEENEGRWIWNLTIDIHLAESKTE